MSRYKIDSTKYFIAVGYDQALRTFFAVVEDPDLPEEEYILLWVGTTYDEINSVSQLRQSVADFCSIPDEIAIKLSEDSAEHFEPSNLQSFAEHLFNQGTAESDSNSSTG